MSLNAEVAEKVMGWEYIPGFASTMAPPTWHKGDNAYLETAKWHPDTSIADAWLVVEEMRGPGKGNWVNLSYGDGFDACLFECEFQIDGVKYGACSGESICEAICKAALEAVK